MIGLFLGLLQCSCNPIDYILIILEDVRHTVAGEPSKTGVVSLTGRELSHIFFALVAHMVAIFACSDRTDH